MNRPMDRQESLLVSLIKICYHKNDDTIEEEYIVTIKSNHVIQVSRPNCGCQSQKELLTVQVGGRRLGSWRCQLSGKTRHIPTRSPDARKNFKIYLGERSCFWWADIKRFLTIQKYCKQDVSFDFPVKIRLDARISMLHFTNFSHGHPTL